MELLVYLLALALMGLVVGALARLALPGRDPMSLGMTIGIGMAGTFLAGIVGFWLFGPGGSSFLLALIFAVAILYFVRRRRGGGLTDPGVPPGY